MSNSDEILVRLVGQVQEQERQIGEMLETVQNLREGLVYAFKEMGYDYGRISNIKFSRRKETIQDETIVVLDPEEYDPDFQDEVARQILAGKALTSNEDLIEMQQPGTKKAGAKQDGEI